MLNRLMFVYFIQRKGFLDNDTNYLRNRLTVMRETRGDDKFYSFYRHFLLRLFHEGLGSDARSSELDELLGSVPYLNGGLFDVHSLEHRYTGIQIADEAFENIFEFFDGYSWHLDERPLRADNEINPDVLGYIFEKYINQKEMGAYYTKEDITGYIARNCIIPHLIDRTRSDFPASFEPEGVWELVRLDPDRYIYSEVLKGVDIPLPNDIAMGIDDLSKRSTWNGPALSDYALPSETWREHIERRRRCVEVRARLAAGQIRSVEDFVAMNLNLFQFAQDIIENSERPELVRSTYDAIRRVSILDPTCGSGAFLFAALNILEPLYEACLERMQAFIEDAQRTGSQSEFDGFVEILRQAAEHPNRRYFILKSIVLNNLFGVDVMEEAVEICKLRLFLKLAAQVDRLEEIEPLPDIDFNIRPGNTLVGFASYDDVKVVVESKLDIDNAMARIDGRAASCAESFAHFRRIQTLNGGQGNEVSNAKVELRDKLGVLATELDQYLARDFNATSVDDWRAAHQPFHWLVEFYAIIADGGFDVIIGNPPYVEYRSVRNDYTVRGFQTLDCGDLYALVMERAVTLLRAGGRLGMITPVSILGTDGFQPLRGLLLDNAERTYLQGFAERPSKLFTGVEKRLAIWMMKRGDGSGVVYASKYRRWLSEERDHLFATSTLADITNVPPLVGGSLPKVQTPLEVDVLRKLAAHGKPLGTFLTRRSKQIVYYTRKVRYFVQFFLTIPKILNAKGATVPPSELKQLAFHTVGERDAAVAALNSNLWFWFFNAYSDVRNVNRREIEMFPIDLPTAVRDHGSELSALSAELMADFQEHSVMTQINYARHGVLTIQVFQPRASKNVIDRVDRLLAKLYGLTDEEADFIVNYDIKYRLGQEFETEESPA